MALTPRLEMRQSQGMVMTPQLLQSIKLLQLNNVELSAFVDAEIERNPLIEKIEGLLPAEQEKRGEQENTDWPQAEGSGEELATLWAQRNPETDGGAASDKPDTGSDQDMPDDSARLSLGNIQPQSNYVGDTWPRTSSYSSNTGEQYNIEATIAQSVSLRDHLAAQLAVAGAEKTITTIAHDLLDRVDESGYMRGDIEQIANRLGVEITQMDEALALIQTFEPTGICARNLAECLKIQLTEKDRLDPAMDALVDNLALLADRDFASLSNICGVNRDDLVDMMREIQALDPKPGTLFENSPLRPVIPDVIVTTANDGSWNIELNSETLPRILVNQSYFARVSKKTKNQQEVDFLGDCLQSANWLHKSLDQRAQTILKVATEIIRLQDEFLMHGVAHLKPLNLRTVADAINMHESTVSRVTSNKYMLTSRGIFELKYFFTAAIQSTNREGSHSAEAVRHLIRQLIDQEQPAKVLSDDKIVAVLRDRGIDIARRTVAKYREAMFIPSSVQRRREKKAIAAMK